MSSDKPRIWWLRPHIYEKDNYGDTLVLDLLEGTYTIKIISTKHNGLVGTQIIKDNMKENHWDLLIKLD